MRRLKRFGAVKPQIEVVSQDWQQPTPDERVRLGMPTRSFALVREVVIRSEEGVWMFARTILPQATLTGKERQLAHLKNRALGSRLFQDASVKRSPFELACFTPGSDWYDKIQRIVSFDAETAWARRSVFQVKNKPLLLTEVFLSPELIGLSHAD